MNKRIFGAAAFAVALASASLPSMAGSTPTGTIHQAQVDFNKGNYAAWSAACADSAMVTDDIPPYAWSGPGACNNWLASFRSAIKAQHMNNISVLFGAPIHMQVSGNTAYLVLPATLHFSRNGKLVRMGGNMMTVVMRRASNGDWRMTAWTWADGK